MYLSDETVRYYHRLISSILQTAVQWQIIPSNPCTRIKPPKVVKKEGKYLEDTDILKLFECLKNEPLQYKTMIILLIYSGMRRGELLGLKWSDVDFNKKTIYIHQELLYLPKKGIFEETTKTYESKRIIKIADIAIDILLEHKNEQENNKSKIGDQWIENNYIFTQWNGLPFHPDTLTSWFSKFIKKYNLPNVTIHSLRHTNASLLIANGVNIITVSKRLGHSNASTTTDIYSHAIKSADEAAANTLQNLLLNKNK